MKNTAYLIRIKIQNNQNTGLNFKKATTTSSYNYKCCQPGGVPNFSAAQSDFLIVMPLIPNFKNNSGDKQIIDAVIHENE